MVIREVTDSQTMQPRIVVGSVRSGLLCSQVRAPFPPLPALRLRASGAMMICQPSAGSAAIGCTAHCLHSGPVPACIDVTAVHEGPHTRLTFKNGPSGHSGGQCPADLCAGKASHFDIIMLCDVTKHIHRAGFNPDPQQYEQQLLDGCTAAAVRMWLLASICMTHRQSVWRDSQTWPQRRPLGSAGVKQRCAVRCALTAADRVQQHGEPRG